LLGQHFIRDIKQSTMEIRLDTMFYREGYGKDLPPALKRAKVDEEDANRRRIDEMEEKDLTPSRGFYASAEHAVFTAKPSPHSSNYNWGTPTDVPNDPGLLFPYFDGMLIPDTTFIRQIVAAHFLRNLGTEPKDAFNVFRTKIASSLDTRQGKVVTHIFAGIELALQCQARLFLLFDEGLYLGFTLLGSQFRVVVAGTWHVPLSEDELQAELKLIQSHSKNLEDLRGVLNLCKTESGDAMTLTEESCRSSLQVLEALSQLSLNPVTDKERIEEIRGILSRLQFRGSYRTLKPASIVEDLDLLLSTDTLPDDRRYYIPLQDWAVLQNRNYRLFCSYGPYAFSFRNMKGDVIGVPAKDSDEDWFALKVGEKLSYPSFFVSVKVVSECVKDWEAVVTSGQLRMDFGERAGGSRNQVFQKQGLKLVWDKLKELAKEKKIGTKEIKKSNVPTVSAFESVVVEAPDAFDFEAF